MKQTKEKNRVPLFGRVRVLRGAPKRELSPAQRKRQRSFRIAALCAAALLVVLALFFFDRSDASRCETYLKRASAAYQNGEYDRALSDLRRAAEIDSSRECLMLMVDCYEAQENWELALEVLRQMDTADTAVAARIGAIEQRRAQQGEAVTVTVAGLQLPPEQSALVLDGMGLTDAVLAEVRQLKGLSELSLQNNSLRELTPLASLGGLSSLNLSGNRIEDLTPLSSLTGLRSLYLDGNPIRDLRPLYALQSLRLLSIRDVAIDADALAALSEALPDCAIYTNASAEEVSDITLGGVTFKSDVTSLSLSGMGIRDISALAACKQLKVLDLSDNGITSLQPLMNLPALEQLNISGNEVSDLLPLMGIGTLRTLNAADNMILETASAGAMTNLTSLDLSGNPIQDFSGLRKLLNLRTLRLANVGITDADLVHLEPLSSLVTLDLDGNDGLSNESMGQLHYVLPHCAIIHADLVYTVEIAGRSFASNITELKLGGLGLGDLTGLERFSCLETVDLSSNEIYNILLLQHAPSRSTIRVLDLSHNSLDDLSPLSGLTAIEELDLSYNSFTTVQPLKRLTTLRRLKLSGNELSEAQLTELRAALPDCEIIFEP